MTGEKAVRISARFIWLAAEFNACRSTSVVIGSAFEPLPDRATPALDVTMLWSDMLASLHDVRCRRRRPGSVVARRDESAVLAVLGSPARIEIECRGVLGDDRRSFDLRQDRIARNKLEWQPGIASERMRAVGRVS